jgi:hypothetical protein
MQEKRCSTEQKYEFFGFFARKLDLRALFRSAGRMSYAVVLARNRVG